MGTPTLWVGFNAAVLAMLALDLGIFHRHSRAVSLRGAAAWSAVWVSLSLGFNLWILRTQGAGPALEFFTGYLIEKSLSLDNLFVFLLVFRSFGVALQYQHRVLFWGVMGALVMRGALVGIGAALVARFAWIVLVLGAFLVIVGVRMLVRGHPDLHPERNSILRWLREIFPIAHGETGERFFVLENGRRAMTALFLALVVLEGADVIFALDSVPAVFGITRDPFLVYTSNVCAILGLRAFYFLLAGALPFFRYLNAGISAVLIFVGGKMLVEPWIRVSAEVSLLVVGALLGAAVAASLAARASESTPG